MFKKVFVIALIFLMVFGLTAPAYCDTALKKLGRGICNIVTSPFELFHQTGKVNQIDGPMAGLTYGVLKGVAMIGVRAIVGVYEIATFPIPLPKNYGPILKDPEFFYEGMNW